MSSLAQIQSDHRNRSELAYDLVRRDILHGQLFPGEKLLLDNLSESYGVGTVPLREALNRLSSEGLVIRKSHRGFFVSTISMRDLEELVKTRVWVDTLALRESIQNGDDTWEEELALSCLRLARTQRRLPSSSAAEISDEWEALHRDFHMLLLSRCGSRQLLAFCSSLMDQAVRYRSLSLNTTSNQLRREGAAAEHQAILDSVLERNADRACELLTHHYLTTLGGLRHVISE
jgi:GntR family carbon starvation induced transcriptional regulator